MAQISAKQLKDLEKKIAAMPAGDARDILVAALAEARAAAPGLGAQPLAGALKPQRPVRGDGVIACC